MEGAAPQLAQIEQMCESLYKSQDPTQRQQAEQMLRAFSNSADYIPQCRLILDQSQNPYAQHLAANSIVKLLSDNTLSAQLRLELRNYVFGLLANRGTQLESFVSTALVQLLARVTKVGWWDNDQHRDIVKDVMGFLTQPSPQHYFLGLKILNQLVTEMNTPTSGYSLIQQRKTAMSFRDNLLQQIFQISLQALDQLHSDGRNAEDSLKEQAIQLVLRCLSYDFVGTSQDDSAEDLGTIQVPSSWRPLLEEPKTLQLLLDVYASTTPPLSCAALECLVRMASVRRSLFASETERTKYLTHLINGTREILSKQQGLQEHSNYHEFCRLLGRLKNNYQLSALVSVDKYSEWIQLVADFSIKSLQSWQWASGSVYYLLCLWSRLVSSVPYLKGESPSLLETFVPKITETYITSRLDSVRAVAMQGGLAEDPLDNEDQLQDQLDSLPHLCRFQYEHTLKYLTNVMDPLLQTYSECVHLQPGCDTSQLAVLEGQLTWLVYVVGAIIRGRLSSSSAESQEVADGELALRVFQLIRVTDSGFHATRYGEMSRQRLDLALLLFFQHFRKVYVGEQVMHSSKVYTQLSERLGLHDHLMVLNETVRKITTNLQCFVHCDRVVEASLNLLQELAAGYMSGKLLLKLETINYMLANHTQDKFPFLGEYANSRNRSIFYYTLGRLLFMEDSAAKFKVFMEPIGQLCTFLAQQANNVQTFRSDQTKFALIGLFRDLRGIAQATNTRKTYSLLFEWLYNNHMPLVLRTMDVWADSPEVTTPLLKFFAEFVLNKTQRLTFDSSSVNGILLFREVSKLLVTYGQRILQHTGNLPDPYRTKYKGIWICLTILTRALSGNYVNFGVFELYGDPALKDALDIATKMSLSVPLTDVLAFRKVGKAYFALLEVLCQNHIKMIVLCDTPTFAHLAQSLEAGLKSLDVSISSQCASAIDNLAAFYFNCMPFTESSPAHARAIATHIASMPNLFPEILRSLFDIVLFEDCSNQWSLSRPMLSLILINENFFGELKQQIAASQPTERRQRLLTCFDKLMTDVTRTLESKNRDRFTQSLSVFRHEFTTPR